MTEDHTAPSWKTGGSGSPLYAALVTFFQRQSGEAVAIGLASAFMRDWDKVPLGKRLPLDPGMTLHRSDVYAAIDSERAYQKGRWTPDTTTTAGLHSVAEFTLFMDDYLREAKSLLSRQGEPVASKLALQTLRKVVALGVACMEQHGVEGRSEEDINAWALRFPKPAGRSVRTCRLRRQQFGQAGRPVRRAP